MDEALSLIPTAIFFVIGTIAVASSVLVVAMRNPVHSAIFLLVTFLCVAVIFILLGAEFVGAVQILVYAGGIMVLFLFVVMLINVRDLPEEAMISPYWKGAIAVGLGVFILFGMIVRKGDYATPVENPKALRTVKERHLVPSKKNPGKLARRTITRTNANSEAVGMALYQDYLVPFEVASLFLLVAMIGAIVIGKRELEAEEEESTPDFITERVAEEKKVKEAVGA